jgi:hypothetical protein
MLSGKKEGGGKRQHTYTKNVIESHTKKGFVAAAQRSLIKFNGTFSIQEDHFV